MYSLELKNDDVNKALASLQDHLQDMSKLMNELGELIAYQTEQRFDEGIDPDGIAWAPKSEATIAAYKARKLTVNFKPLFGPNEGGDPLRQSIFHDYGTDSVEVGTAKVQGAVMQFGAAKGAFGQNKRKTPIPWGNIPARPFLGLSEQDGAEIVETTDEWLARLISE